MSKERAPRDAVPGPACRSCGCTMVLEYELVVECVRCRRLAVKLAVKRAVEVD